MIFRLAFSVLVMAFATSVVHAQPRMPSQEDYNGARFDTAATRRSLAVLAECMVKLDRGGVAILLATPPGSKSEFQTADRSRLRSCMELTGEEGQLALTPQSLRGPLSEAMLVRHYPDQLVKVEASAVAEPYFARVPEDNSRYAAWLAAFRFAVCVRDAAPGEVASLFRTAPSSVEEKVVVDSMAPAMGACLSANSTIAITRLILRSMLAEVSYQAAVARAGGQAE